MKDMSKVIRLEDYFVPTGTHGLSDILQVLKVEPNGGNRIFTLFSVVDMAAEPKVHTEEHVRTWIEEGTYRHYKKLPPWIRFKIWRDNRIETKAREKSPPAPFFYPEVPEKPRITGGKATIRPINRSQVEERLWE